MNPEKDGLTHNNQPMNKNTSSVRGQLYLENGFLGQIPLLVTNYSLFSETDVFLVVD